MIRWVVALLLLANLALFFWGRQQAGPSRDPGLLPPPEIGHLELLPNGPGKADAAGGNAVPPPGAGQPPLVPAPVGAGPDGPSAGGDAGAAGPLPTAELPPAPALPADAGPRPAAVPSGPGQAATDAGAAAADAQTAATDGPGRSPAPATAAAVEVEAPALPPSVAAIAAQLEAARAPSPVCARIGPVDGARLAGLKAGLPGDVELLSEQRGEAAEVTGYFVLIPPLPTRADGEAMLRRLAEAGVTDTWLFRRGESRNGISLGLFDRESTARRHAADMTAKGFAAEVEPRTRGVQRTWLLVRATAGSAFDRVDLPEGASVASEACPP